MKMVRGRDLKKKFPNSIKLKIFLFHKNHKIEKFSIVKMLRQI